MMQAERSTVDCRLLARQSNKCFRKRKRIVWSGRDSDGGSLGGYEGLWKVN